MYIAINTFYKLLQDNTDRTWKKNLQIRTLKNIITVFYIRCAHAFCVFKTWVSSIRVFP